jgi:hypothetical protein
MTMWGNNHNGLSQFGILIRHFFNQLFLNDTGFFEVPMMGKVIGAIAILSVVPGVVADALLFKYLLVPEQGTAWAESSLFISLVMLLIGFVTIFAWEAIALDRNDYLNLMPLPLGLLTVFAAKFVSLVMFIAMFAIGINAVSSIVFTMYLGESWNFGVLSGFSLFLTHLIVMLAAGIFIFFTVALTCGILRFFGGGAFYHWLSDLIRLILMTGQIYFIYSFLTNTNLLRLRIEQIQGLKESPSALMMNFPPLWFAGLYQVLLGNHDDFYRALCSRALLALASAICAYFLVTLVSYRRQLFSLSPEAKTKHSRMPLVRGITEPILNMFYFKSPAGRAVSSFFSKAISRSRIHRAKLIAYLGVGAGIAAVLFASVGSYYWKSASGSMLSLPLVMTFFLLVGLKKASDIPLNDEANWVFQITETENRWCYFSGLRIITTMYFLLPLHALFFIFYCFCWNWQIAGRHCLYDLAFAVLLLEVIFFRCRRIPFTCSQLSEKSRLHISWLTHFGLFFTYTYVPRWLEPFFLKGRLPFIVFFLVVAGIVTALRLYHKISFYPKHTLIYEEDPEPVFIELSRDT